VKFDASRVTAEVKQDIRASLEHFPEIATADFGRIYDTAVQAISVGGDLRLLTTALRTASPELLPRQAGAIAHYVVGRARVVIERARRISIGLESAIWLYSVPCLPLARQATEADRRRDAAHQAAHGCTYSVRDGMLVDGKQTHPGYEEGCRCVSKAMVPGFS
jgi:hypothetical protein